MILRQQETLGYATFPVILSLFRVLSESLAAIPARSLIRGTRVACQETFLLAPDEPTAACFGNARSLTAAHGEPVFPSAVRPVVRIDELERNTQNLAIPTLRFARKVSTFNPPSHAEGSNLQKFLVE